MGKKAPLKDGLHFTPKQDGTVELQVISQGEQIAGSILSPEASGDVAAKMLTACHGASEISGPKPDKDGSTFDGMQAVPVTAWFHAFNEDRNRETLAIQTGETVVGFAMRRQNFRALARYLTESAQRPESPASSFGLLCDLLLDFGAALRGWGGVVKARISAASRRRATSFSSWISGHSFRSFCFMGVTAGDSDRSIGNIGHCIYCDAEVYSKKPHVRDEPFGDEHIIPEGMGGNLVLEDASCESCEGITGLKVENQVLGRTLIAVIHHWGLRTRKKPPAPMRLMGQNTGGKNVTKPIPIDDYPIVFYMLKLLPIELSEGDPKRAFAANGVIFVNIKPNLDLLKEKYGIINPAMPHWNLLMFVRMLAKIGHSLGAAELGLSRFKPLLLPLIKKGTLSKMRLVGGPPSHYREGESEYDHEVSLGYQKAHGTHYVVAKVRLFAKYGGPTYFVVVGESLESRMARFNRVLSNKISFMLRR